MSTELNTALQSLRDVQGMYGSFIVSSSGSLIERDVPAIFDDKSLEDAGLKLSRIFETFGSTGSQIHHCQLRFKEHKLISRRLSKGYLCVLAPISVNMATLRMAVTLVVRRVDPMLSQVLDTMKRQSRRVPPGTPEPLARVESGSHPMPAAPPIPAAPPPVPSAPPPVPSAPPRAATPPPAPSGPRTPPPAAPGRPRGASPGGLVFRGQKVK